MTRVALAHTAALTTVELDAVRTLLDHAFLHPLSEQDYEHSLGGMHALVWNGSDLLAHGAVVLRRLLHNGRALRTGYVEGVAVRADRRRHGYGAAVMATLEPLIRGGYELGALGATWEAEPFYRNRGWQQWTGTTSVVAPGGVERTREDDGRIYVLPVSADLEPHQDLACDWRNGEVW